MSIFQALSLQFMQNAIFGAILISIACGIIGSVVVINRMSYIAGGIAHGAYGGIGIAFFFSLNPLLGATVFSILLALVIATITLKDRNRVDAVIGAIWAFGMAIGIIFSDLSSGYNTDLMSYLFGSILSVSKQDLMFMGAIDILFLVIFSLLYRQIVAISFDNEFAKLRGIWVDVLYYVMICLMALCVVATIRMVGLILVIALLSIPAYIAQNFCKSLGTMMLTSTILSMFFCLSGLYLSFSLNLTSGASIILIASICFFAFTIKKAI